MNAKEKPWSSHGKAIRRRYMPALATVCVGTAISILAFVCAGRLEKQHVQHDFLCASKDRVWVLDRTMEAHRLVLESLHSLYVASQPVERHQFGTAAGPFLSSVPGIQALEWVPRIPHAKRGEYEAAVRREGLDGFQITQRHGQGHMVSAERREAYFPVHFIEPQKGNEVAVGFDLASDPTRLAAIRQARDTGQATATGRVTLVQETGEQFGYLIFLPIYEKGAPVRTIADRREHLQGLVLGVFRIGDVLEQSLASLQPQGVDVRLYDTSAPPGQRLLYCHPRRVHDHPSCPKGEHTGSKTPDGLRHTASFDVGGRRWSIVCTPTPAFVAGRTTWHPWVILGGGLLVAGLLATYLLSLVRHAGQLTRVNLNLTEEVAEREQAQEARRMAQFAIDRAGDAVFQSKLDGRFVYVNDAACTVTGYSRDELLSMTVFDVASDVTPSTWPEWTRGIMEDRAVSRESLARGKDGRIVPIELTVNYVAYNEQQYYFAFVRDVTERRRTEQALRESEQRFRTLTTMAPAGIYLTDAQGRYLYVNDAWCRMAGRSAEQARGQGWIDALDPDDRRRVADAWEQYVRSGGNWAQEYRFTADEGKPTWVFGVARALTDEAGNVTGHVGLNVDITEQKTLERQFLQAQKMEAVGRLAGGVAHDFRNQLTVVKGYCHLLLKSLPVDSEFLDPIRQINQAADRATATTTKLLAFSRKQTLRPELLDLNEVLLSLDAPLARMIGDDVKISVIHDPGPCTVKVDRSGLEQAILNLTVNARDAMPEGGTLTLETAMVQLPTGDVGRDPGLPPGWYVMLAVRDTGTGMDAETRRRVFEPFFTTKEVDKGTGLGLSTVYGFVKQSGGGVEVVSGPGRGAAFRIYLPPINEPAHAGEKAADDEALPGGSETVLVVEDERPLKELIVDVLRRCGYHVLDADSPREAIALAASRDDRIDLLVTDVVMPEMHGQELAGRLRAARPDVRVLFISGYSRKMAGDESLPVDVNLLAKPFDPRTLARAVRGVLGQAPMSSATGAR